VSEFLQGDFIFFNLPALLLTAPALTGYKGRIRFYKAGKEEIKGVLPQVFQNWIYNS
jgi:hypothetical protein